MTPPLRTLTLSVIGALALLLVLALIPTNLAALQLREHLLRQPARPFEFAQVRWAGYVRGDVRARLEALAGRYPGSTWDAAHPSDVKPGAGGAHAYATAVRLRRWVWLSDRVSRWPEEQLRWRARQSVPASAPAAVLQRGAESVALADPPRANEWARLARRAQRAMDLAPLPPGDDDLAGIAGLLEGLRRRRGTAADVVNGNFEMWSAPLGTVAGWEASRPGADYQLFSAPRFLRVCSSEDPLETVLTNTGFQGTAGATYAMATRLRAASSISPVVTIGLRFLEPSTQTTVGAYVFAGRPDSTWTSVSREWQAPPGATKIVAILGVAGGTPGACVDVEHLVVKGTGR